MTVLGKLGIDIKILIAQIINFLILLFLLKILLYKPILKMLQERKQRALEVERASSHIKERLKEVKRQQEELIRRTKERTRMILERAEKISQQEKKRLMREAEEEVKDILEQARQRAEMELEEFQAKEQEKIESKAIQVLKDVLSKSFIPALHRIYIEQAINELKKADLAKLKAQDIVQVNVISAVPLSDKERKVLSNILSKKIGSSVFQEKVDPDIIAGIVIKSEGFLIDVSLLGKIKNSLKV